ncbi:hypothetical protein B484DRAFT_16615 [Ochromonadaceae sp. CCMP2298]|nr:hypothetical protein B484DRAFT_16615 [Ochromonadaceae sp. CCMP2298]
MAVGAALFPVILAISSWPQFLAGDSAIFILGTILLVLFASYVMIATQQAGSVEQATRIKKFSVMVCAESSYLLPQYYPEADMQPEEYRQMYKQ